MRFSKGALDQLERIERRMKAGQVSMAEAFELSKEVMDRDERRRFEPEPEPERCVCHACGRELN